MNPKKIENILNKTHINTAENILSEKTFFSQKVIQFLLLTLSDNERILRQLPFIDDARILVVPVSEDEV